MAHRVDGLSPYNDFLTITEHHWTRKEREFLETLHRVLPKLIQEEALDDHTKSEKDSTDLDRVLCDEGHGFKYGTAANHLDAQIPSYPVYSKSTASVNTLPTHMKAMKNFDAYARSCKSLRAKLQEFENKFRSVGGGMHAKTSLLALHKELVSTESRLHENVVDLYRNDALDFEDVQPYQTALYHTLSACAHGLWALYNALMAFCDEFYESGCLEPLNELAVYVDAQANFVDGRDAMERRMDGRETLLYLVNMLPPISEGFDAIVSGLSKFIDTGIPAILAVQQAELSRYLTMTGVATFFSAVTATSLQLAYTYPPASGPCTPLGVMVNTLWFCALVFSTASAVNSLLGLTWRQTPEATLVRQLPTWASMWLIRGPMISLVIASAAFSVGLCLFAFSSAQHIVTSTLTTAFTFAHALALFVLARLYVYDQRQLSHLRASPAPAQEDLGLRSFFAWLPSCVSWPTWKSERGEQAFNADTKWDPDVEMAVHAMSDTGVPVPARMDGWPWSWPYVSSSPAHLGVDEPALGLDVHPKPEASPKHNTPLTTLFRANPVPHRTARISSDVGGSVRPGEALRLDLYDGNDGNEEDGVRVGVVTRRNLTECGVVTVNEVELGASGLPPMPEKSHRSSLRGSQSPDQRSNVLEPTRRVAKSIT